MFFERAICVFLKPWIPTVFFDFLECPEILVEFTIDARTTTSDVEVEKNTVGLGPGGPPTTTSTSRGEPLSLVHHGGGDEKWSSSSPPPPLVEWSWSSPNGGEGADHDLSSSSTSPSSTTTQHRPHDGTTTTPPPRRTYHLRPDSENEAVADLVRWGMDRCGMRGLHNLYLGYFAVGGRSTSILRGLGAARTIARGEPILCVPRDPCQINNSTVPVEIKNFVDAHPKDCSHAPERYKTAFTLAQEMAHPAESKFAPWLKFTWSQ